MFDPRGWALAARLGRFDSSGKPTELHPQLQWYLQHAVPATNVLDLRQAETELQAATAA